jgi:signal transduction histidine kinase
VLRQVTSAARARAALESSRHKSEFISMMSHELRTPLNAIIGYAELIQEEGAHQPQYQAVRDDAECILVAARHLHHLFNDVLDQSRIDAGHLRLRRERVLVSELLADIEDLLAPMARANGNTLTLAAEHPAMSLVADHQRVRQCLLNLVGNALKFTKNGAVSLRARHAVRDGVQCVTFDVVDTGIGISRESTVDVFEPFTQAEAIQLTYGGAGLGLSISRKLARAMGGDISFVSEAGKGSCFSLNLPASALGSETSADTPSIGDAAIA